jgi:HEAT repeat protein
MSELPIKDLESESAQTRLNATSVIADAIERGTALDAAVESVIALLADSDQRVRDMAKYILQTDAERDLRGRTIPALRAALSTEATEIRRGSAFLLAGCLARQEDGLAVAALAEHTDRVVRLAALNAIANGAVPRAHTDAVVTALANVLTDDSVDIRKEAIWALYLIGSEGAALTPAIPGLERALEDAATQGNAAIAIALAWRVGNRGALADALYDHPNGSVQMGAAWGAADAYLRHGDVAALKKLFASDNENVRRGLGAFLHHARKQRRDISLAGQAFAELEREHPDDMLLQVRLHAVRSIAERGPDT